MIEYINEISDELKGAKEYKCKAENNPNYKDLYKAMASQELEHAMSLHKIMLDGMTDEEKSQFNDLAKMLHQYWVEKYKDIKEEIETL